MSHVSVRVWTRLNLKDVLGAAKSVFPRPASRLASTSTGVPDCESPGATEENGSRPQPTWITKEIRRFDPNVPVEKARTPPASWYIWDEFAELDNKTVFANNWIAVCRWDQLKEPGSYVTGFIGDEPYIVARDENRELRAFYNVCRHHATLVTEEAHGSTKCFTCPYHGWQYGLDGRLLKATRLRGIQDFKAKEFGLKPINVAEWGPLIFLNLSGAPPGELSTKLATLTARMDEFGDSRTMKHVENRSYEIKCNWKVYVDNYLDGGYHVEYAHKALAGLLSLDSYKTELFDGFSIQGSGGQGNDSRPQDRVGSKVLYTHIYPNVMLNRYGPWLDINYVFPDGPNSCTVVFDWFLDSKHHGSASPEELEKLVKDNLEASETVQQEDIEICERVQKGLKSRGYDWGRYSPRLELADHDFHLRLQEDYLKNI